jgi:hypothetical protein
LRSVGFDVTAECVLHDHLLGGYPLPLVWGKIPWLHEVSGGLVR